MWVLSNALRLHSNTTCPLAIGNCFLISPLMGPRATLVVKQEDELRLIYPLALKIITHFWLPKSSYFTYLPWLFPEFRICENSICQ